MNTIRVNRLMMNRTPTNINIGDEYIRLTDEQVLELIKDLAGVLIAGKTGYSFNGQIIKGE